MNGRPPIGSIAFGTSGPVRWATRVPSPPIRMTTGDISAHDDLRALVVEAEPDLAQSSVGHRNPPVCLVLGVQKEEAATTSSDELPSGGAGGERLVDPAVDLVVQRARRALELHLPLRREQGGKGRQVAG